MSMRYYFSRSLAARQSIRHRLVLALLAALIVCGLSWASKAHAAAPSVSVWVFQGHTGGSNPYALSGAELCTLPKVQQAKPDATAIVSYSSGVFCTFK
ncbi:hypothetical protein, partial [Cupriavidus taiwanensis]|uniref:hypothetical protein n=1 Tax=Cupriavidus taiwanensis TaxID=164546 RepID=UPI001E3F7DCF